MAAYMKNVAPFLGVGAQPRKAALREVWRGLPPPSSDDVGSGAVVLMAQREREFHYAAYDAIARFRRYADADFLGRFATGLLTTRPWWDTVDGLVSAAVSPLSRIHDSTDLIDEWSGSEDIWLIRAAITHQRGWKTDTNVPRVLDLCDRHWTNREFFVAKAIGWALRDIARLFPAPVARFLADHPESNAVALREARRGLAGAER